MGENKTGSLAHIIELQPVTVPNFVRPSSKMGTRQDDFTVLPAIPVSELSVGTLEAICEDFKTRLFEKAGKVPKGK